MIYQYSDLETTVNSRLHGKIGVSSDIRASINTAVRNVWTDVDIRSSQRRSALSPRLFQDVYTYTAPSDLKGTKIMDIRPQAVDVAKPEWLIVPGEEFERKKLSHNNLLAIDDYDDIRKLKISIEIDDGTAVISELDSLTSGGGTWVLFGDGTNLTADTDDFVHGNASINWDISAAGGTTAGIQNTGLNTFDVTSFLTVGSALCWVYLTSATNVTNLILRVGSSSSNYYSMTATTSNESAAFVSGWQLVRWDFSGKTTTGTPDDDACDYAVLYMTKAAGKVSETDYKFDYLVLKKGDIWNVHYYSKFPWQTSAASYIENSTVDGDYINASADEYNLIVEKCIEQIGYQVREYDDALIAKRNYAELKEAYESRYPSESVNYTSTYYNVGSIEGDWWTGRGERSRR